MRSPNGVATDGARGPIAEALEHFAYQAMAALPPRPYRFGLDVGAGSGASLAVLGARCGSLCAVDNDVAALPPLGSAGPTSLITADACALPFADAVADVVHWGFLVPHVRDLDVAVSESARVLRPGGLLLATTWGRPESSPLTGLMTTLLADAPGLPPAWSAAWRDVVSRGERLVDACVASGLDPWYTRELDWLVPVRSVADWRTSLVGDTTGLSRSFWALDRAARDGVLAAFDEAAQVFAGPDGECRVPARALVVMAERS